MFLTVTVFLLNYLFAPKGSNLHPIILGNVLSVTSGLAPRGIFRETWNKEEKGRPTFLICSFKISLWGWNKPPTIKPFLDLIIRSFKEKRNWG